jgi:hypothetical protein
MSNEIELTVAPSVINYTVDRPYKITVDRSAFEQFIIDNEIKGETTNE